MTKLLDIQSDRIRIIQPSGRILIDSNTAPPTLDGSATFTNVAIVFQESGHGISDGYVAPYWRRFYPGGRYKEPDVILGPSGTVTKPDFMWGRYNLTQTHGSVWVNHDRPFVRFIKNGEWTPFTGSVHLERQVNWSYIDGDDAGCFRYFYIDWVAGDWVLKPRWSVRSQSSFHFSNQALIPNSYGRFFGTIELSWGSYFGGEV